MRPIEHCAAVAALLLPAIVIAAEFASLLWLADTPPESPPPP